MEPHLYLKRGKKNILLVRYFDKLHFVTLDHRMSYKVRPWFLEKPRTEQEMEEMGLIRTSIPLKDIRGVAAGGTGRGHVVQFYLQEGKRRYELKEDCRLSDMSALFAGLESFDPPKKDSNWQDPRLARQDPKLRRILWALGWVLNIVSFACGFVIWVYGFEIRWICWICLLCIPLSILLYCLFPDYFTIFADIRKRGQKKGALGLWSPVACPACMILGAMSCYTWFNWWKAWTIGATAVLVLALTLYFTVPILKSGDKLFALLLAGLLLSGGPVLALNHLLDTSPVREIYTEVVDKEKHTHTRSPDVFELTVVLEGKLIDIPVGGRLYSETEIGEMVTVECYQGALGIPYARIV